MMKEAEIKQQIMQVQFGYDMQLAQLNVNTDLQKEEMKSERETNREAEIENRKDKRLQMQGTQQSELIDQRQNDLLPKNFESSGNDNLDGFGLEQFTPR
jgi:hypothetical protein